MDEQARVAWLTLPSRSSRDAPPPVEMWLILSARPAFSTAATESPPPMMVIVPCSHTLGFKLLLIAAEQMWQPESSCHRAAHKPLNSCVAYLLVGYLQLDSTSSAHPSSCTINCNCCSVLGCAGH